ncbi:hypothetical protein JGU71_16360 [Antrihabitans sp. YC3-6]|uniref:Uncharacterized protein n=1 Tax=Antrihabitans stalagmiti TaxID=2799499 RepID=A0A934NS48_9NOCA|nr:hypothetical protein [Antrihabitans stalagmiti]MBJ8340466.1 hypothetical protein [Antrihabitans stalagmiti]
MTSISGRILTIGELTRDRVATLCDSPDPEIRAVARLYRDRPGRYPMAFVLLFDDVLGGLVVSRLDQGTATADVDLLSYASDHSVVAVKLVAQQIVPILTKRVRTLRRISCAIRDDDDVAANGLAAAGFESEGWAPPYLWDDVGAAGAHREMWTYFVDSSDVTP